MENHEGKGGSYTRNADGTLTLVERTLTVEEAAPLATDATEGDTSAPAGTGKKKTKE